MPAVGVGTSVPPSALAIKGVTVIEPSDRSVTRSQTVVVEGPLIATVGRAAEVPIRPGTTVIDGTGRYLIPGLWDMHVHDVAEDLPLYLPCGITGVRAMGGSPESLSLALTLRDDIAAGLVIGPRLVLGAAVDGPRSVVDWVTMVSDPDSAREAVTQAHETDADFVKVFSFLPWDAYFAIADEAHRRSIPFAGHVPHTVTAAEATEAGQSTVEHLTGVLHGSSVREVELLRQLEEIRKPASLIDWMRMLWFEQAGPLLESQDADQRKRLLGGFAEHGTWHVPTLGVLHDFAYFDELPHRDDPRLRWQSPDYYAFNAEFFSDFERTVPPRTRSDARARYALETEIVRDMHAEGVGLLTGTDAPPSLPPGLSLHHELASFIEAGLTPIDALGAATTGPARALGISGLGEIKPGAIADLVVLDADPLANIRNTERIHATIANGRLLDRSALNAILAERTAATAAAWEAVDMS